MISPNFLRSTEANLAYWRAQMGNLEPEALVFLEKNRQNLYQGIQVGLTFPETHLAAIRLALDLYEFIEARNHFREWIPLLKKALLTALPGDEKCRLLNQLGYLHAFIQIFSEALEYHQQALTLSQATRNAREEMNAYFGVGHVQYYMRDYLQANTNAQIALAHFRQLPPHANPKYDPAKLSAIYILLGNTAHAQGHYANAESYLLLALETRKHDPNTEIRAKILSNLAFTYEAQHKTEEAEKVYQKALALYEQTRNTHALNSVFINLGSMYFRLNQLELAEKTFQKVDQSYLRQTGDFSTLAVLANNFGNVYLQQSRLALAQQFLDEAIGHWRQLNDKLNLANTLSDLAETYLNLYELETALPLYLEAIPILKNYPQDAWARKLLQNALTHAREAFPEHPAFV